MNTITLIVTILTLWLVMGLGYLAAYFKMRRQGKTLPETLRSIEGMLFIASIVLPLVYLAFR